MKSIAVSRDQLSGRGLGIAASLVSLAAAVVVFSRIGIQTSLSRDEAIYAYGGQQLAHGVLPYTSIFDAKTPLPTFIGGLAAGLAHLVGRNDFYAIRAAYFVCACLTVLAMYLLASRLWRSPLAGLTAALVFVSFRIFAVDALAGPNAKTPGILFAVVSMWLLVRRQWFWAALAGSLSFLVWQPMVFYPAIVVVLALLHSRGQRLRHTLIAMVGAAVPVVVTMVIFAAGHSFGHLVEGTLQYPLQGVHRTAETVPERLVRIAEVVHRYSGPTEPLLWVGVVLFFVLALGQLVVRRGRLDALAHPVVSVLMTTFVCQVAYAATDFQSYPDLYPFLPYAALGIGGAVGVAAPFVRHTLARRTAAVATVLALGALVVYTAVTLERDPGDDNGLRAQLADGCAVQRLQTTGSGLYSLGDPTPLVLTHARNPDRFVYLASGVDRWKVAHLRGGFDAWVKAVVAEKPAVVVISGWAGRLEVAMDMRLREAGYRPRHVGTWFVLVSDETIARATASDVRLRLARTPAALSAGGHVLPPWPCR